MDVTSDISVHTDRFASSIMQSSIQAMTVLSADSLTGQAAIGHPFRSNNGNTAQEEADSVVITDVTQKNEEDDDYASKSDLESDDEDTPQKPLISERRRNQNNTFLSWLVVLNTSNASSPFLTP